MWQPQKTKVNGARTNVVLSLLFLFLPLFSFSQDPKDMHKRDSMLAELPQHTTDDTNKVLFLAELAHACFDYKKCDSDGYIYAAKALTLAKRLNYVYGQGLTHLYLGRASRCTNYTTDLDHCFSALKIFERLDNDQRSGQALCIIGGIYYTMQKYSQAAEYFEKQRATFEKIRDTAWIATADQSLGGTYQELGAYQKALHHEQLALSYFEQKGVKNRVAVGELNIGNTYASLREYNKALVHSLRAYRQFWNGRYDRYDRMSVCHDVGLIYFNIARDTVAAIHADSLVPAGRKANLDKAIRYFKAGYEECVSYDFIPLFLLKDYSDALAAAGNADEALKIYREYTHLKDSTLSNSVELTVSRQETKREEDLRKREAGINLLTVKQKRTERLLFAAGLALLGVVAAALYRNYRTQKRINHLQQETLLQKDMLMKEIHHRVKNNLQVISTLLELQMGGITDEHTREAISESNARLKAISLIHQQLYQEEHMANIEFAKFTTDLHTQIAKVFNKTVRQVMFSNDIPHTLLDIDTSVPLGLALNELMTNSYKHAFRDGGGSITVRCEKMANGYKLTYSDSGAGLPVGTDAHAVKTLGMRLIYRLSKQLAGTFSYVKTGNEFIITFKDLAARKTID